MKRAILSCTGLDKPEGSLAREVALLGAEATGSEIICPVLLNRSPARYRKELGESALIVIDGCATRCASKLAAQTEAKVERKVLVYDEMKTSAQPIEPSLRLGPNGLALAKTIADRLINDMNAPSGEVGAVVSWTAPTEFLTVTHDKFEFRIPAADYLFNENDCWVRTVNGTARIGISDYMQQRLTDIGFFTPPDTGIKVEQFGELGSVESAKAVFEIVSPVSGTVTAVNAAVVDDPGLVNSDPYGAGWLVEVELENLEQDRELLLDGAAYSKTVKRKAAEP
jgi:glycine cleavage system H protein